MLKLMILLLVFTSGVLSECAEKDEIECSNMEKCVKIQYICDGDYDCGDKSDEESQLCYIWRNKECSRGMAYCRSSNNTGYCVDLISACNDTLCIGDVDQRLCSMLRQRRLKLVSQVDLQMCQAFYSIECQTTNDCVQIGHLCDNVPDCEDMSDEAIDLCKEWKRDRCSGDKVICRQEGKIKCITEIEYCNVRDCEGPFDRRLCFMLSQGKIMSLSEIHLSYGIGKYEIDMENSLTLREDFLLAVNHTIRHEKCPQLYTQIADECISVFHFANLTWGEARAFCQTIGGDLYVPRDRESFFVVTQHLRRQYITSDFWLGGGYNHVSGWHWVDGEAMELGTHYWAIRHNEECNTRKIFLEYRAKTIEANDGMCYHYTQEPVTSQNGSCVAITYKTFFFMSPENCLLKKSPLCKLVAEAD